MKRLLAGLTVTIALAACSSPKQQPGVPREQPSLPAVARIDAGSPAPDEKPEGALDSSLGDDESGRTYREAGTKL